MPVTQILASNRTMISSATESDTRKLGAILHDVSFLVPGYGTDFGVCFMSFSLHKLTARSSHTFWRMQNISSEASGHFADLFPSQDGHKVGLTLRDTSARPLFSFY